MYYIIRLPCTDVNGTCRKRLDGVTRAFGFGSDCQKLFCSEQSAENLIKVPTSQDKTETAWFIYISTRWRACYINWTNIKQFYAWHDRNLKIRRGAPLLLFAFLKIYSLHEGFIYIKPHNHAGPPHTIAYLHIEWLRMATAFQKYVVRHATVKYQYMRCVNIYVYFSKYYCNYDIVLLLRSWRIKKWNLAHIEWPQLNAKTTGTIRIAKKNINWSRWS